MADTRWQAVAALVDPVRRALYDYVRRQDHPVTREEAADAHAISRNLTAFHLDKLVDAELLRARYEAPSDQPRGRGRTPKVYEPTAAGFALTVPPRQYALAGEILADAIAEDPTNSAEAAPRRAFEQGRRIGQLNADERAASQRVTGQTPASQTPVGQRPAWNAQLGAAQTALADLGFEPHSHEGQLSLRNCPFHTLAARQPDLICGLNVALISGLLAGLGCEDLTAHLRPQAGACCVTINPHSRRS